MLCGGLCIDLFFLSGSTVTFSLSSLSHRLLFFSLPPNRSSSNLLCCDDDDDYTYVCTLSYLSHSDLSAFFACSFIFWGVLSESDQVAERLCGHWITLTTGDVC